MNEQEIEHHSGFEQNLGTPGHVDQLSWWNSEVCSSVPVPEIALRMADNRFTILLNSVLALFFLGISVYLAFWLSSNGSWNTYVIAGLGTPLAFEFFHRIVINMGRFKMHEWASDQLLPNSEFETLDYAFRHKKRPRFFWQLFQLIALFNYQLPFVSLTIFLMAGVPVGLHILEKGSPLDFNLFIILGGLIPGVWMIGVALMAGFCMKKVVRHSFFASPNWKSPKQGKA